MLACILCVGAVAACGGATSTAPQTVQRSTAAHSLAIYVAPPDDPKAEAFRVLLKEHFAKLGYTVTDVLTDADIVVSMSFTIAPHKEWLHFGPPQQKVDVGVTLTAEGEGTKVGTGTGTFVFGDPPPPDDVDALCSSTLRGPVVDAYASRRAAANHASTKASGGPAEFAECDGDECTKGNPGTWIFHGTTGVSHQQHGAVADLTIKRFDADGIVINRVDRTDSPTAGLLAVYVGKQTNGRIDGTFTATWPGHVSFIRGPWFATVPVTRCDPAAQVGPQEAMETGGMALRFQHLPEALGCFLTAASQGNGQGKVIAGIMYRDGVGTAPDPKKAFELIQESAIQGEYNAQLALSQMYEAGTGTPADPAQAEVWKGRALQNPVHVAAVQSAEQQKRNQEMMFMGLAAVVEALAAPRVYVAY